MEAELSSCQELPRVPFARTTFPRSFLSAFAAPRPRLLRLDRRGFATQTPPENPASPTANSSMEQVYQWARSLLEKERLDASDAELLKKQKVNGKVLLGLTEAKLVAAGMPMGPAAILAGAIAMLPRGAQSAQAFDGWVRALNIEGCTLKPEGQIRQPHILSHSTFPLVVGRADTLQQVYGFFAERQESRKNTEAKKDRLVNPLVALHSPPGGGKSKFLDVLAQLVLGKSMPGLEMVELPQSLRNTIPVVITFNAGLTEAASSDPERDLVIRCIFSLYFTPNSMWGNFRATMSSVPLPNFSQFISIVQEKLGGHILLLVDELMKAGNGSEGVIMSYLSVIGGCLDQHATFNAVVTILDQSPVIRETTRSGRGLRWPILRTAELKEAISLFSKDGHLLPSALRQMISDCAGHFRSLEYVKKTWNRLGEPEMIPFSTLLREFLSGIPASSPVVGGWSSSITIPILQAALRGERLDFNDVIPGTTSSFRELVATGVFVNSFDADMQAIPRLHPLALMKWATNNLSRSSSASSIASSILAMLDVDPGAFEFRKFEEFQAHYEALRRELFHGEARNLEGAYGSSLGSTNPSFLLQRRLAGVKKLGTYIRHATAEEVGTFDSAVILPGLNNPGFDILLVESTKAEKFALCIECRYSFPRSETSLDPENAVEKYDLAVKELKPHFAGLGLKSEQQVYLVVAAFRDVPDDILEQVGALVAERPVRPNIIVLNREQLKRLYTPTLASRPQFYEEVMY